jgi:hypothetical protein
MSPAAAFRRKIRRVWLLLSENDLVSGKLLR